MHANCVPSVPRQKKRPSQPCTSDNWRPLVVYAVIDLLFLIVHSAILVAFVKKVRSLTERAQAELPGLHQRFAIERDQLSQALPDSDRQVSDKAMSDDSLMPAIGDINQAYARFHEALDVAVSSPARALKALAAARQHKDRALAIANGQQAAPVAPPKPAMTAKKDPMVLVGSLASFVWTVNAYINLVDGNLAMLVITTALALVNIGVVVARVKDIRLSNALQY
jgi:hypothetical protein